MHRFVLTQQEWRCIDSYSPYRNDALILTHSTGLQMPWFLYTPPTGMSMHRFLYTPQQESRRMWLLTQQELRCIDSYSPNRNEGALISTHITGMKIHRFLLTQKEWRCIDSYSPNKDEDASIPTQPTGMKMHRFLLSQQEWRCIDSYSPNRNEDP